MAIWRGLMAPLVKLGWALKRLWPNFGGRQFRELLEIDKLNC